jgi:hypothetical protein
MLLRDVKKKFPIGSKWSGIDQCFEATFEVTGYNPSYGEKSFTDDQDVGETNCVEVNSNVHGKWTLNANGQLVIAGDVRINMDKRIDPKLIQVLENEPTLINGRLFENLEEAQDCPVCAVGALIRGLPEDQFADAIEFMREKNYNGSIGSTYMKPVQDMLTNHYNLSVSDLQSLMAANDYAREQERKEKVLKKAKEIAQ